MTTLVGLLGLLARERDSLWAFAHEHAGHDSGCQKETRISFQQLPVEERRLVRTLTRESVHGSNDAQREPTIESLTLEGERKVNCFSSSFFSISL